MLRILLGIEDYNELLYLQTFLKKIGFDTDGVQNEKKFADLLLGFNPQVVILSGLNKKGLGTRVIEKVKKRDGYPKIILLRGQDTEVDPVFFKGSIVDKVMDRPVQLAHLIQNLAHFAGMDAELLQTKFDKISIQLKSERDLPVLFELGDSRVVESTTKAGADSAPRFPVRPESLPFKATSVSPEKRKARFAKALEDIQTDPKTSTFARAEILKYTKEIRRESEDPQFKELDEQRRDFVRAMFDKNGKP